MNESGIQVGLRYPPCHQEPLFQSAGVHPNLPVTERTVETLLCLPLFPDLPDDGVTRIVDQLEMILAKVS